MVKKQVAHLFFPYLYCYTCNCLYMRTTYLLQPTSTNFIGAFLHLQLLLSSSKRLRMESVQTTD